MSGSSTGRMSGSSGPSPSSRRPDGSCGTRSRPPKRRITAKMSSWRWWATSFGTRWPPSATRSFLQEVDTAGHATAVQVVARQSLHLARVAHDLLDLSRIGRGKLELQTGPVELQTAVAAAVETAQAQIGRRGQTLSVEAARCADVAHGRRRPAGPAALEPFG